jgi:phage-related protein
MEVVVLLLYWNQNKMRKHQHKPLYWLGDSLEALKTFSEAAKREAGHQLNRVQDGFEPNDWKPMTTVGVGVREVRIKTEKAYRVIYVAKFFEGVYVLHAFDKKTQRTSKADLDLATARYKSLLKERK